MLENSKCLSKTHLCYSNTTYLRFLDAHVVFMPGLEKTFESGGLMSVVGTAFFSLCDQILLIPSFDDVKSCPTSF